MLPKHYRFQAIFDYNASNGTLTPRFNIIVNGVRANTGSLINQNTSFGGLNLLNYVGRGILGNWNATTRELTIVGFY